MKEKQPPLVGILYNVYVPRKEHIEEAAAEEATELCAREVAEALLCCGFQIKLFPVRENIVDIIKTIMEEEPAIIVNLCESYSGNSQLEGNIAALLELLGLPFTGNRFRTLMMAQDKYLAKSLMQNSGLPVPAGWLIKKPSSIPEKIRFPLFLKPNYEDGSIGIREENFVNNRSNLKPRVRELISLYKEAVLAEEYIEGREFNVSIIETQTGLKALPPAEIKFLDWPKSTSKILSYEAKWNTSHRAYRCTVPVCPAEIPEKTADLMQTMAIKVAHLFDIKGYARVDMRMKEDDNAIYILEINPNPDASREAGLSRALEAAGITYNDFWKMQIAVAMKNHNKVL